MLVYLDCARA
ncbi:hypothetical protein F383_33847 [Gossypium arboreum]|uniref:Uncharacterized protein n=1 Tax=Gossypium arboreum TaxID=29729 RepID=A0A0B0PL01_GOSAR|nr:hypothetical protein F383_33847 [Gossypium arboreum]